MRTFETGANRDKNDNKINYMGHISPLVTRAYAEYMHACRTLPDGTLRAADNWKLGMPEDVWLESLVRHMEDVKLIADGYPDVATTADIKKALCAVLFNTQGLLYQILVRERATTATVSRGDGRISLGECQSTSHGQVSDGSRSHD